jgi:type I site-specific restriction endonuclease
MLLRDKDPEVGWQRVWKGARRRAPGWGSLRVSPVTPEDRAREEIDRLLEAAGWYVCDFGSHNISQPCAIREFPLKSGHGHADYLLYLQGKAVGVVEAKKAGYTLKGVEVQSAKYTAGLPEELPAWDRPLPFSYESTGKETQFTNNLDPEPRSRRTFAFHLHGKAVGVIEAKKVGPTLLSVEFRYKARTTATIDKSTGI